MKCLLKIWIKSNVLKYPSGCLEIRFLLTRLLGEQLCPSPYTFLSRQSRFPQPNQKSLDSKDLEERKEMAFDLRLANITDLVLVFRGLYCPSANLMNKALHEITANSQGSLNPFSLIVGSLVTSQRHIITSRDT